MFLRGVPEGTFRCLRLSSHTISTERTFDDSERVVPHSWGYYQAIQIKPDGASRISTKREICENFDPVRVPETDTWAAPSNEHLSCHVIPGSRWVFEIP